VRDNIVREDRLRNFESMVCWQTLIQFRATRAVFYEVPGAGAEIYWREGLFRDPTTNKITKVEPEPHDDLVEEAREEKIAVKRIELTDEQRKDPGLAALEGLVERVCIPVIGVGILDMQWTITARQAHWIEVRHNEDQLWMLSQMIGLVYRRHQFKEE